MMKIIEVKETLFDTQLADNIYSINKIVKQIINQTEFVTELNRDDYNYLNVVMEKVKIALDKAAYLLMKE